MTLQPKVDVTALDAPARSKRYYQFVFTVVALAVFILPSPSVFISVYPDTLRPESVFLLLFLIVRLITSGKFVKFSLEFSFLMAICFMAVSIFWAAAGLGIHIVPQDFVDIYYFLVYWAVFRYGYELTIRYHNDFIRVLTFILFCVVLLQFAFVLSQRMNIDAIIHISSWWSHDYDAAPWLRVTRPHGMTVNAISLSILMALFFTYFLGQVLSQVNFRSNVVLSQVGMVLSVFIVILSKSRSGFALLVLIPFLFGMSAKRNLRRIMTTSLKVFGVMTVVIAVIFGLYHVTGYQGQSVLSTATIELVGRIGNFAREGLKEKEGAVGRIDDARIAFTQVSQSPYVGVGPAYSLGKSWFHSSYITLVRRYGGVGLLVYLTPYLLMLLQSVRYVTGHSRRSGGLPPLVALCSGLCMLAGGITSYTFIGEWQMNFFFWLVAGVVVAKQRTEDDLYSFG